MHMRRIYIVRQKYLLEQERRQFRPPAAGGASNGSAVRVLSCVVLVLVLCACDRVWNSPHTRAFEGNVLHSSFAERPKHLDPVRSYSSNEYALIGQIYEPPLQYHYLKRPYQLEPLTALGMPKITYVDGDGRTVSSAQQAVFTRYEIRIRPGIRYQPHPAFARRPDGAYRYHRMDAATIKGVHALSDFEHRGTRELLARDYVYQIKRLADPALHSPLAGLLGAHIQGFAQFGEVLTEVRRQRLDGAWLDLGRFAMSGVEVLGRYRYRITVDSAYPQFIYWLAMPFFAPMPWEADLFHSVPGLADRNITLNWYPLGSGAYMMTENDPNRRMVLERNPNYHDDRYPQHGEASDRRNGLLADAGRTLPFIDKVVFNLEKEDIPYWNKFLQGYYDSSGIHSDSFDQAITFGAGGEFEVSDEMRTRGVNLASAAQATVIYIGFNMLDPVVGGYDERAVKLRRALSIAVDMEEYISIFLNGRGIAAQGPIAPGVFGYRDSGPQAVNSYVYDQVGPGAVRKPLAEARRLMREAGYAGGIDRRSGAPLVLYFDTLGTGPDAKSFLNWMRKQFAKLDVQLVIRNTDYNRFQEKMLQGGAQIFRWGWNADYPDPENFLFLLYGANAKVGHGGENASNYRNPQFDRLFEQMKSMPDGAARQALIDRMLEIVRHDAPWIWGVHPKSLSLHHAWMGNYKPNLMAHNVLKYRKLDVDLRARQVSQWNRPRLMPLLFIAIVLAAFVLPAIVILYRRRRETAL